MSSPVDRLPFAEQLAVRAVVGQGGEPDRCVGTLKNALDWVVGSGDFYGKPVGALAAGSTGGAHALAQLALTLGYQGALMVAELGIAAPKTKVDGDGRYVHAATLDALRAFTATVLQAASVG